MPLKTTVKKTLTIAILFLIFTDSTTVNTKESDPDSGMANGRSFYNINTHKKV